MYAPDFSRPARMVKNPISATPLPRSRLGGLRDRFHFEYAVVGVVVVAIGYLVLVPLGYLLWNTFVADGTLTLDNFRRAYSAVGLGEMTVNSLWFTAGTTAVAVGLGTALAYLVVRTDLRFKPLVVALTMTQLIVPGVLHWQPKLTVAAAAVLAIESLVFIGVHVKYGEIPAIIMSAVLGLLMAFIAYGRMVLKPIS